MCVFSRPAWRRRGGLHRARSASGDGLGRDSAGTEPALRPRRRTPPAAPARRTPSHACTQTAGVTWPALGFELGTSDLQISLMVRLVFILRSEFNQFHWFVRLYSHMLMISTLCYAAKTVSELDNVISALNMVCDWIQRKLVGTEHFENQIDYLGIES